MVYFRSLNGNKKKIFRQVEEYGPIHRSDLSQLLVNETMDLEYELRGLEREGFITIENGTISLDAESIVLDDERKR